MHLGQRPRPTTRMIAQVWGSSPASSFGEKVAATCFSRMPSLTLECVCRCTPQPGRGLGHRCRRRLGHPLLPLGPGPGGGARCRNHGRRCKVRLNSRQRSAHLMPVAQQSDCRAASFLFLQPRQQGHPGRLPGHAGGGARREQLHCRIHRFPAGLPQADGRCPRPGKRGGRWQRPAQRV